MGFSFWEQSSWFTNVDFTIIGSGITGLNCAWRLRERFPEAKILVLERGLLPNGASTKNAGFACFGSIGEIVDDLKNHGPQEVLELISARTRGLALLRKKLGDQEIQFEQRGGYEVFRNPETYHDLAGRIGEINNFLRPVFAADVFGLAQNDFGFQNIHRELIYNRFEGQIDTGKMMAALLKKVQGLGVRVLTNSRVCGYLETSEAVTVETEHFEVKSRKLFIATNGFAGQLGIEEVKPARAQVLITHPLPGLEVKGTFHLDRGYYYFRNVDDRILLGGGRNLDPEVETTTEMETTDYIQGNLERLLREIVLPNKDFLIDHRWSGIMGVGPQKRPIIKRISEAVYGAVRLGGMGVAIGTLLGQELADLHQE